MKFVMSYSCGKDSTLALHKAIAAGHEAVALLIMVNEEMERSYFHGADYALLERYGEALKLPLILCPTAGETYHLRFEEGLSEAKALGAEAVCFGDIDLEDNRTWGEERCKNTGMASLYPLWQRDRKENVRELIALGYRAVIKSLNRKLLPEALLGKTLDEEAIRVMEDYGVDVCGENGEYHTLTVDGPIFHQPVKHRFRGILTFGDYSTIEVI